MNPITNIKNQNALNERELRLGTAGDVSKSWHNKYKDSAWIYIGGLPYDLTEGDVITVFSQYGEVMNINLVRDRKTGKSKGFCFLCYQDQRSTVLAVDNFNGITLLKRMLRVDHVDEYKVPKYREDADEETKRLWEEGCAPKPIQRRKPTEDELRRVAEAEERKRTRVVPLKEDEDTKTLKKIAKKHKKELKKQKKREKKLKKKLEWLKAKAEADPDGDWKDQIKLLDQQATEEELYGQNEHFNFGKEHESKARTHNLRPDFEKADWRDVAIWQTVREQEKAAKAARGEKEELWGDEVHFVAKRHQ